MSILDEFARSCVLMEKKRVPGNEGGWTTTWEEGAEFVNHPYLDTSMELAERKRGRDKHLFRPG